MLKTLTENPKTTDQILIEVETTDSSGCAIEPYRLDSVIIYHVERNYFQDSFGEYTQNTSSEDLIAELQVLQDAYCDNPTEENLILLNEKRDEIAQSAISTTWSYQDRKPVLILGNSINPAWFSTDEDSPFSKSVDEDGNEIVGQFEYLWEPDGSIREGQYFCCWTWTPLSSGEKLSSHIAFSIAGDTKAVTTIPTHRTVEDKYETLLERYLPELYKISLCEGDLTPETTYRFNNAIADGFTVMEDYANQLIDLFDSNVLHESLLVYLSNLFNLKLKSSDPTLWRRQIKEAIPTFKKKGTLQGLKDAFSQSGMTLETVTQFWQVVSRNTFEESFVVSDSAIFELSKEVIPLETSIADFVDDIESTTEYDPDSDVNQDGEVDLLDVALYARNFNRFKVYLRREGEDDYTEMPIEYVEFNFDEESCKSTATWIGDQLSTDPVFLYEGDIIRFRYLTKLIRNSEESQIEEYLDLLPLADLRDETEQQFPIKNWNVKLIEETDPLFSLIVPARHPFYKDVIFGNVRTEFPYGENIYNMEEYNGSTRPSTDPCDIDKEFLDECGECLSSTISISVSVEELTNDRMLEAQDILDEYLPFHTQVRTINFSGDQIDFIQPPTEEIVSLINYQGNELIFAGNANPFFSRTMEGGLEEWVIERDELADKVAIIEDDSGLLFSTKVCLTSPLVNLQSLGIRGLGNHFIEILSPSSNAGIYTLDQIDGNSARINGSITEPVDESEFTFQVTNRLYSNTFSKITERKVHSLLSSIDFDAETIDISSVGIQTIWNVNNTADYTGGAWSISINDNDYDVQLIENGILYFYDGEDVPASSVYTIKDDLGNTIFQGIGAFSSEDKAIVDLNDSVVNVGEFRENDLLFYNDTEYTISGFEDRNLILDNYTDGDVLGADVEVRRRILENATGYLGYKGLNLRTTQDWESTLGIINGSNPPIDQPDDSLFKENFFVQIDGDLFKIISWDGTNITLSGLDQTWPLEANPLAYNYSLFQFEKENVSIQFTVFDHLDRDGQDPIIREIETSTEVAIVALSTPPSSGFSSTVSQTEEIEFFIETREED